MELHPPSVGQKSPTLVGFSAIKFYVYALWDWNFLTFNIYLFDILGQILGFVASHSYRPRFTRRTLEKLHFTSQILTIYKLAYLPFYRRYAHQIYSKINVNNRANDVSLNWQWRHAETLWRHEGFFQYSLVIGNIKIFNFANIRKILAKF